MKINAYAKINLMLDVIKKRDDGFHDVKMIMQTLNLCDVITAEKSESGITVSGSDISLDYGESNLAHKAAVLFFEKSGILGGAKIHIEKNIPICAGMAGGSSDAAAVLIALNELYGFISITSNLYNNGYVSVCKIEFYMVLFITIRFHFHHLSVP